MLQPIKKSPFGGVEVGPNSKAQKEANWHFWTTIPSGDATCRDGVCGSRWEQNGETFTCIKLNFPGSTGLVK